MTADGVEDWESRVQQVWASTAIRSEADVLQAVEQLAAERPPQDPTALFERASAHDYAGEEVAAEHLYRRALEAGLTGDRRTQAVIQLASTLRLLGRATEAVDLLDHETTTRARDDLDGARAAFLALALADAGQERRALATALTALTDHLPRYQRAVRHYAQELHPAGGDLSEAGEAPAGPGRGETTAVVDGTGPGASGSTSTPPSDEPASIVRTAAGAYEITTDLDRMDLHLVHRWLSPFWKVQRPLETVATAARNSVNFAAFTTEDQQVAYARVVTDHATFAWLCDFYVDQEHRGRGLGTRLARDVVSFLRPLALTRVMLTTVDAHDLYRRVGFETMPDPEKLMLLT